MRTIRVSGLSGKSFAQAREEIHRLLGEIQENADEMTRELTERGVKIAKDNAMFMDAYDTGALVNGIQSEYRNGKGYVVATAPHSAFVEFGTGIRGKESQHPNPGLADWKYDVNEHGEEGWFYKGDDGEWHWTAGMPSRPYMYNTMEELNREIPEVARMVFEK